MAARARDEDSSGDDEEHEEEEEEEDKEDKDTAPTAAAGSGRRGRWTLTEREFLWDPDTEVSSVSYNSRTDMLVVGFTRCGTIHLTHLHMYVCANLLLSVRRGVFGLYEMPGCVNVHRLSVSTHSLDSVCISPTGRSGWRAAHLAPLLPCPNPPYLYLYHLLQATGWAWDPAPWASCWCGSGAARHTCSSSRDISSE